MTPGPTRRLDARTEILSRIRGALSCDDGGALSCDDGGALSCDDGGALSCDDGGALSRDGGDPGPAPTDRRYGRPVSTGDHTPVARFAERVADYRATVTRVPRADLTGAVADALAGVTGTIVADAELRDLAGTRWIDGSELGARDLDRVAAVVTTAAVGIANTGTIVLDHRPGQGRRALSLVPDVHVCIVDAAQIVSDVPEAVARLVESGSTTRPQTWISGPSATSDIELDRVEGVHGPRTLHVVICE